HGSAVAEVASPQALGVIAEVAEEVDVLEGSTQTAGSVFQTSSSLCGQGPAAVEDAQAHEAHDLCGSVDVFGVLFVAEAHGSGTARSEALDRGGRSEICAHGREEGAGEFDSDPRLAGRAGEGVDDGVAAVAEAHAAFGLGFEQI